MDDARGRPDRPSALFVGTGQAYQDPAHDRTDSVLAIDAANGRILDHFQATAGDVWNATSNAHRGPDHDFGASPNLIEGPDGRPLVGMGQKSGTYWAFDRDDARPRLEPADRPAVADRRHRRLDRLRRRAHLRARHARRRELGARQRRLLQVALGRRRAAALQRDAVANGVVYTTDMSGFLTARDAATGVVLTKIPLGAPSWGGVSVAGGTIFAAVGTQGSAGYIAAYRVRTGNEPNEPADHWDDQQPPEPAGRGQGRTSTRSARSRRARSARSARCASTSKCRKQAAQRTSRSTPSPAASHEDGQGDARARGRAHHSHDAAPAAARSSRSRQVGPLLAQAGRAPSSACRSSTAPTRSRPART